MLKLKDMTLANNIKMPPIGLGVYKMQEGSEMNQAVKAAYENGYRLFDTAQMYGNEAALGTALKVNNIPREDIFLVSKVDNGNQWYEKTLESLRITLEKLQTPYLDAFLIHWPGQDKERTLSTWKAMEEAYESGMAKSIGVCNFEICQLQYLMEHCRIRPMINQIEHNPLFHQPELVSYCKEHQVQIMAWAPLQRGNFDETVQTIAEKYQKTPAQILLRWNIQQGIIPIPKSKNPDRLRENIDIFDFTLKAEDMNQLDQLEQEKRTSFDPLTFDF